MTVAEHYKRIAPGLTNYLVASGSSYQTACDIVQETFLRVWKHRDDLMDDASQVSGYIYTIARNLRKDMAQKAARMTLQEEITDADVEAGAESPAPIAHATLPPIEEGEERRLLRQRLSKALSQIQPLLREAFLLFAISVRALTAISTRGQKTVRFVVSNR